MKLADYMDNFGWSQAELAYEADVSVQTVARALAGETLSRRNAVKIVETLENKWQKQGLKGHITLASIRGLKVAELTRKVSKREKEPQEISDLSEQEEQAVAPLPTNVPPQQVKQEQRENIPETQEVVKLLLEVDRTHPFEMRVLVYKAGHDLDLTGTWLEQVRGADENAILSVAQMWFDMRQEPCAIFKHEEDGSEQRLFGYPLRGRTRIRVKKYHSVLLF